MKRVAFDATALAMLLDEAAPGDAVERRALVALVGIAIERLAPAPAVAEILVYYDVEEQVKIAHALRRSFKITPMGIGAAMEVGRLGVVPSAARNSTRQGRSGTPRSWAPRPAHRWMRSARSTALRRAWRGG